MRADEELHGVTPNSASKASCQKGAHSRLTMGNQKFQDAFEQQEYWDQRWQILAQDRVALPPEERDHWGRTRLWLTELLESKPVEVGMGVLIAFNIIIMMVEVDQAVNCNGEHSCIPEYIPVTNNVLLGFYSLDVVAKMWCYRFDFWTSRWHLLDLLIVVSGYVEVMVQAFSDPGNIIRMIRTLRIARVLRAVKLFNVVPELHKLVTGILHTMTAIIWGFIMIIVLVAIFSLLAVQLVQPMIDEIFSGDEDIGCKQAFSSVWSGSLFFFQTLVAGDAWGQCSLPIIVHHPLLASVFSGAFIVIQLGFTNLVLSVIVDTAAEKRNAGVEEKLKAERAEQAEAMAFFWHALHTMDKDGNGTVSYAELMDFYYGQEEIQHRLNQVGIDKYALTRLYQLLDVAHEDEVKYHDFLKVLMEAQFEADNKLSKLFADLELRKVLTMVSTSFKRDLQKDNNRAGSGETLDASIAQLRSILQAERLAASSQLDQEVRTIGELGIQLRKQLDAVAHDAKLQAARLSRLSQLLELPPETLHAEQNDTDGLVSEPGPLTAGKASNTLHLEANADKGMLQPGSNRSHLAAIGGSQVGNALSPRQVGNALCTSLKL
eukprot:TRINITY_DN20248_c0_g1_i1.p1 TRINITY_DN20248_c0_g1~~TRINITY_DN20248_c0_g1_i1.p1  ORF type:complete len:602 (+),score=115.71 TRINITY_DN20248_c0_g1_i1:83-1888(+)